MSPNKLRLDRSWPSPISAGDLTGASRSLAEPGYVNDQLHWLESIPEDNGRVALMRRAAAGQPDCLTPAPLNVRTNVHEYGGGAWHGQGDLIVFNDLNTQAVMAIRGGERRILVQRPGWRFADFQIAPGGRWLAAVAEIHDANRNANHDSSDTEPAGDPSGDPENRLVYIDTATGAITTLAQGEDFYAAPAIHPDGNQLAFISWVHPNMPWDHTTLQCLQVNPTTGAVLDCTQIDSDASILEPRWAADGSLLYATDSNGFWNIASWHPNKRIPPSCDAAEYTVPAWVFGNGSFVPLKNGAVIAQRIENGIADLWRLRPGTIGASLEGLEWVAYSGLTTNAETTEMAFIGSGRRRFPQLITMQLSGGEQPHVRSVQKVRDGGELRFDPDVWVSEAEAIRYPTADGSDTHGFFYPPRNPDHTSPAPAPLVVLTHGGPTAMASPAFNPRVQFYTSRGWAVLDVNYGGSTGFGSAYRQRLRYRWGEVDVEDCVAGVRWLTAEGRIDPDRVAIRGGSAGGYTTLAALTFTDVFRAGASHYGVGDLSALAQDTHKFESHYMDSLVAPWPAGAEIYRQRSAIAHAGALNCPVIFFQGTEDKVVPPNQSEAMAGALKDRGVPVALVMFAGEGHGFRMPANAQQAMEQEFAFLCRAFAIACTDNYPLPPIDNAAALPALDGPPTP